MRNIYWLASLLLLAACSSSQKISNNPETAPASYNDETVEKRVLDTLYVSAPKIIDEEDAEVYQLPSYNPSATRSIDLLHTKLDLLFDWEKEWVIGKAQLTLEPYFYPVKEITLDAVNFDVKQVRLLPDNQVLEYNYDGQKLVIDLYKSFNRGQKIELFIDYVAKPAEAGQEQGGAITSDQGLFFINPRGEDPNKPMQIWTQGETEYNSRWFPTVDKPNERCTQEISLTVEDRFQTLSNGLLTQSRPNPDGTRTDTWKMDKPHAPYLFMVTVGEFAVVEDKWEEKPLMYYVEPEYEEDATAIFAHTPEMLSFFSEVLDYPYPWDKYAQVVVRDYVSGAMENTSAVIFGEFVQQKTRELIDDNNDAIVAHEMFHHWFGDLVTCESWANLTLNEGFANYSEYLWFEHKYGKDRADQHLQRELEGYVRSASRFAHDLIYYDYDNKESTFDAHSYNKGGLVLHMLRNYLGDEAFFAALNKYLTDNAYSDVEAHELRIAFEEITGQDLNWFFNQWYFEKGHPEISIDYVYDDEKQQLDVIVEQLQDPEKYPPIFQLPFAIDIYGASGKPRREKVFMDQRRQTFSFFVPVEPNLVNVDADRVLLCERTDNKTESQYIFQYKHAPLYVDRFDALQALGDSETPEAQAVIEAALNDPFWGIRRMAIDLTATDKPSAKETINQLALNDEHSMVRADALNYLAETGDLRAVETAKRTIQSDQAYRCISAALRTLRKLDEKTALEYAGKLENEQNATIISALSDIYASYPDEKYLDFFEKHWDEVGGYSAFSFFTNYCKIVETLGKVNFQTKVDKVASVGLDLNQSPFRRFAATNALNKLRSSFEDQLEGEDAEDGVNDLLNEKISFITDYIDNIKEKETSKQLQQYYINF